MDAARESADSVRAEVVTLSVTVLNTRTVMGSWGLKAPMALKTGMLCLDVFIGYDAKELGVDMMPSQRQSLSL